MESEAELVAKWERIHNEHEAYTQKCRQREEQIQTVDNTVSYLELGVDRQECRINMLIDEGLDAISRIIKFNRFCNVFGIEGEEA